MTFKKDVADKIAGGLFAQFSQRQYTTTANTPGAKVQENLEDLDFWTGPREPGLCAGLSAAFLISMKSELGSKPDTLSNSDIQQILKNFKDYVCTNEGAVVVGTVQRDIDKAPDPAHAEVAMADFFSEGMKFSSLKHGGMGATVSGLAVDANALSTFVSNEAGFDALSFGSAGGKGHMIAAINFNNKILVFDPNAGFILLKDNPKTQMVDFATAWFTTKWGNKFANQPYVFSRYN